MLSFLSSPSFMSFISSFTEQSLCLVLQYSTVYVRLCFHNGVLLQAFIRKVQTPLPHPACGSVNLELWIIKRNLPDPIHTHRHIHTHLHTHCQTYPSGHTPSTMSFPSLQDNSHNFRPICYTDLISITRPSINAGPCSTETQMDSGFCLPLFL